MAMEFHPGNTLNLRHVLTQGVMTILIGAKHDADTPSEARNNVTLSIARLSNGIRYW